MNPEHCPNCGHAPPKAIPEWQRILGLALLLFAVTFAGCYAALYARDVERSRDLDRMHLLPASRI